MSVLPDRFDELITFSENHAAVWGTSPPAIGLTAPQVDAFELAATAARTAFNEANAARETARATTTTLRSRITALRSSGGDLIRIIKGFAEIQANPAAVYAAAQIPPPAEPSPAPVPGKPTDVLVTLEPDGAVTLSWVSTNGSASGGAFFNVTRKLPGQSAFTPLGGAPGTTTEQRRAQFTDTTIPATAAGAGAQYIITPFRGTRQGTPSDAITVQFGVDGGGAIVSGATLRMAA